LAIKNEVLAELRKDHHVALGPIRKLTDKEIFAVWGPTGIRFKTSVLAKEKGTAFYGYDEFVNQGMELAGNPDKDCEPNPDVEGYYAWLDKAIRIDEVASKKSLMLKELRLLIDGLREETQRIYLRRITPRDKMMEKDKVSESQAAKLVKGNPYTADEQLWI